MICVLPSATLSYCAQLPFPTKLQLVKRKKKQQTFSFQINCKISTLLAAIFLITCCNCQRSRVRDREREKPPNERRREQLPVTLTYAFVMGMGKRRSNVPQSSFCQFQRRVKSIQNYWQQFILNPAVTPPSVTPPPPKTLNQGRPLATCLNLYSNEILRLSTRNFGISLTGIFTQPL